MTISFTEPQITHSTVSSFANEKVNLKMEDVKEKRDQANRLRENVAKYISKHPEFSLVKILQSGSLRKGTALKTINDIDFAVYVSSDDLTDEKELLNWLCERIQEANPNMKPEQITTGVHCVKIDYVGTGLSVDIGPVHYDGEPDDRGYLINRLTGDEMHTSIPLHLEFIRKRKDSQQYHFTQMVRLVKWWIAQQKRLDENFRMKSFMAEMLLAHLADKGHNYSDYPGALEQFFTYIVKSQLKERIYFTDYYAEAEIPPVGHDAMEILDPVNKENNVCTGYTEFDRQRIVDAAENAVDALAEAKYATTKGRAVSRWQEILGSSFRG
jgi:hypothetical protein